MLLKGSRFTRSLLLGAVALSLSAGLVNVGVTLADEAPAKASAPATPAKWSSIITAADLKARINEPNLLIIDVRKKADYDKGHIPGAINIPGDFWRTKSAKPGEGDSQYIFRVDNKSDGAPDVARYEAALTNAGVTRDAKIVVYGDHAGKADGSIPAMILLWLGHPSVSFLDGIGIEEWKKAGGQVVIEPTRLAKANPPYKAQPIEGFIWNLDDVKKNLDNKDVVFYDTRSTAEYNGTDLRGNKRGGHIPGAVLCNYEEFLDKSKGQTTLSPAEVQKKLAERNITPDKTVVLYCQTATRVSLPALVLKDLGYKNVVIYDASWHEYGNREDTKIVKPEAAPAAK